LMCPSVSVFHISVQWSFNVDQFMQTFDSSLIKNSVKMIVVRRLILWSKFAKKLFVGPALPGSTGGAYSAPSDPPSWIMGEGRERGDGRTGGEGRKGHWRRREGKEGEGRGEEGYPLQMKILAMALC